MKKVNLILLMILGIVAIAFGQTDSLGVDEPSGLANFYNKYAGVIWTILIMSGVGAWLVARYNRLMKAFNTLRVAGDDSSPQGRVITLEEWQGILKGFANVFGKLTDEEKNEIVSNVKNDNRF
jgi:hypothetical protein